MFLLHNEEERENWISAIKKLIPKGEELISRSCDGHVIFPVAGISVSLTSFELQDLLSRQTINDVRRCESVLYVSTFTCVFSFQLRKVEEMIVPTAGKGSSHVQTLLCFISAVP